MYITYINPGIAKVRNNILKEFQITSEKLRAKTGTKKTFCSIPVWLSFADFKFSSGNERLQFFRDLLYLS